MERTLIAILMVFFVFIFGSCSLPSESEKKNNNTTTGNIDPTYTTKEIGPEGDTLQQPGGTILIVPPGALSSKTRIGLKTYTSAMFANTCNSNKVAPVGTVVELLPDGIEFKVPVKLIIPLETALANGSENLVLQRKSDGSWRVLKSKGICISGGMQMSVDINHFCFIASTNYPYSSLEVFKNTLESTGGNGNAACSVLENAVKGWNGDVFSIKKTVGTDMYKVCGIGFDVMWKYGTLEGQKIWTVGKTTSDYTIINDYNDYVSNSQQIVYNIIITLYWEKVELQRYQITIDISALESICNYFQLCLSSYSLHCEFELTVDNTKEETYFFWSYGDTVLSSKYPIKVLSLHQEGGNITPIGKDWDVKNVRWVDFNDNENDMFIVSGYVYNGDSASTTIYGDMVFYELYSWDFFEGKWSYQGITKGFGLFDKKGKTFWIKYRLQDNYSVSGAAYLSVFSDFPCSYTVKVRKLLSNNKTSFNVSNK